jgi:chromosome segregation ATPase
MTCPLTAADEKMKQMAEENKKYFDENQKYKEENTEYRVKYEHKDYDYTQMKQLKSAYGQQKAILTKENENLKKIIKTNNKHFNDVENKCTKLELENENIKKILKASHKTDKENINLKYIIEGFKDEIEELNTEIEEYETTETYDIQEIKELTEIKDAIALHCCCETDTHTTMEYTHALIKDINKLKALVKDLVII